jgi:hypothetical protein
MTNQAGHEKYGFGRVAFLTQRIEIQQEIEAGYTLTMIYEKRKESLGITYSQFARHVQRYISKKEPVSQSLPKINRTVTQPKTFKKPDTPFHKQFEFNPVAPEYDDLI